MTPPAPREHFVPLRKADLLELLCGRPELTVAQRDALRRLFRLVEATFHYEFHARLEALKTAYAAFDPDSDTVDREPLTSDDADRVNGLFRQLDALLARGNYRRLSRDDVVASLSAMGEWGLRVDLDFDVFERLEVYARGDRTLWRVRRRWRNGFRARPEEVGVYQRLVVAFRLLPHKRLGREADAHTVFLKMFKDIPRHDLEMLLPGSRARMSYVDRAKIALPTLSGLGMTGWKVLQGALTVAVTGRAGVLAFLGLVGGTLGYGGKSLFGYLRTKEKYQYTLTRSLYYRNLDNNAGVLFRLLDEAEEQEFREALLGYFVLWRDGEERTAPEIDAAVERLLREAAGLEVDFEVQDALKKLVRLGIVRGENGKYASIAPDAALRAMDRSWDAIFGE